MSIPLSPPLIQISRCCLRASHTPSTTWAAPRTLIRSGSSTNHISILRVLLGPTTHSRECSLGARNSISPSPTVTIAKYSMSLLFHTALLFSSLLLCSTKSLLTSFLAEGCRLPLSRVYREATWRVAWRSEPGYRGSQALQPPKEAGESHRCRAASATRSPKNSPRGLRMQLQMSSRMGSRRRSPRESSSHRLLLTPLRLLSSRDGWCTDKRKSRPRHHP